MGDPGEADDEESRIREEGYTVDTDEGRRFVIFDPENPLAWVMSDLWGTLPTVDRNEDEDQEDGPAE